MQEYKCPNCGAAVEFESSSQKLKCPYCESEFSIEALNQQAEAQVLLETEDKMSNWNTQAGTEWNEAGADGVSTYLCNSCGAEIIADATLGSTTCPYCDSNIVLSNRFDGMLRPDLVIPFKLDKAAAKQALSRHLSGKKLLPKLFKTQNHIDEIKGVYVPFWLFDADVNGAVEYDATKTRCWSSGDYNYTETSHFSIFREGGVAFKGIPVDGSSKMADDLMDSLEPFNMADAVDFNTAYLAGYLADKYDVSVEDNLPRINTRVKTSTEESFRSTITDAYDTVSTKSSFIDLQNGSAKYALLPVWILNTTWNGNKYTFAMNGQTGKFVGNLPMDSGLYKKYWLMSFLIGIPVGAIVGLIAKFLFM